VKEIFWENAEILAKKIGTKAHLGFPTWPRCLLEDFEEGEVVFFFGSHEQADLLSYYQEKLNLNYIIFQSENIESSAFCPESGYVSLLKENTVLDWSYSNMEKLEERYEVCAKGLFAFEFLQNKSVSMGRDIDVFFAGASNENRLNILKRIRDEYPNLNCHFDLAYNLVEPEKISKILRRTKWVLNIPYYNEAPLATHRINKALSAGCGVISPFSYDKKLDDLYSEFVHFGDIIELVNGIDHLKKKKSYAELCKKMKPLLYEF
jgi:hypothetical protein